MAQAAIRGLQLGGDRGNILKVQRKGSRAGNGVRSTQAAQRIEDLQPILAELRAAGAVTLSQIAQGLNGRGSPTARGSKWSTSQVYRVIQVIDSKCSRSGG